MRPLAWPRCDPRHRLRALPLLAGLLLAATAGCGLALAAGAAPGAHPAPQPAASSVGPRRELTLADTGRTIVLRVGQTVALDLGRSQVWSPRSGNPGVVAPVPGRAPAPGLQGVYRALAPGVTTITAVGRPRCAPGGACPMYILRFQVTVRVTR